MSTFPVVAIISLTLLTWAIAIWASIDPEQEEPLQKEQEPVEDQEDHATQGRKVA